MLVEVSGTGMLWPFLIIFVTCHRHHIGAIFSIFVKKMQKNEDRLCPLPYEEVFEANNRIIKAVGTKQCGNL